MIRYATRSHCRCRSLALDGLGLDVCKIRTLVEIRLLLRREKRTSVQALNRHTSTDSVVSCVHIDFELASRWLREACDSQVLLASCLDRLQ